MSTVLTQQHSQDPEQASQPVHSLHVDTVPGQLTVIKRNKTPATFIPDRIRVALGKAFLATRGEQVYASHRMQEVVVQLTQDVVKKLYEQHPSGGVIDIEVIQDQVEQSLMAAHFFDVARRYVLYREERHKARLAGEEGETEQPVLRVVWPDGRHEPLDMNILNVTVQRACHQLEHVDPSRVMALTQGSLFDSIPIQQLHTALILSARALIEQEPHYTYVAARLLLNQLHQEVDRCLKVAQPHVAPQASIDPCEHDQLAHLYPAYFKAAVLCGVAFKRIDPRLTEFDLKLLGEALLPERDLLFSYLGLQTLYDRYFLHEGGVRFELPQVFLMRVAMGLALAEVNSDRNQRAVEFYQLLSSLDFMSSTPTLFNSGTTHSQLSSCFLTTVPDDLKGIFEGLRDNALLSKFSGGLGNDWTPVRGLGAQIRGTNGKSLGVIPFINVANATTVAVNQGGKRKGAVCGYLEIWHIDIEEFAELRKNTGDDRRRAHDMNTAVWVPDLFMQRLINNESWTLFSPDETPDLHDCYGLAFKERYEYYEREASRGALRSRSIPAQRLWRHLLGLLFETGHPWITFKDPCNIRSPQQHVGVIHSSNLCTEITLNTSQDEVAVCNLGSINLLHHLKEDGHIDVEALKRTTQTAIRMLDNVIDINYYPIPQAKNSNSKHRPVGLGIMGFQDALYRLKIPYASKKAVEFADRTMEIISYYAIQASCQLARERGTYSSYEGSLWSQGILPIDSIDRIRKERGVEHLQQDQSQTLDWQALREEVLRYGMRNSNVLAIAPTATISLICGVSQSIEPSYKHLFVKSNLSGEFTVVNPYLVEDLRDIGLWDQVMVNDLKYHDGSVKAIERIPESIKSLYATAFEVEPYWLIHAASRRQKWLDQSQSLNLYLSNPSGKKMDAMYKEAWMMGLKTTYYMRTLAATDTEKVTVQDQTLNAVHVTPPSCRIDDPDCEACQ